jgi:hypothetical protein
LVGFHETCQARSSCPGKDVGMKKIEVEVADVPTSSAIEEILCESSTSMVLACCSKITNKT